MALPSAMSLATVLLCATAATGTDDTKWLAKREDVGSRFTVSRPTSDAEVGQLLVSAANPQAGFTSWLVASAGTLFSTTQRAKTSTQKLDQFQSSAERGCGVQDKTVYFYTIAPSTDPVLASTQQLPTSTIDVMVHGMWCYVVHERRVVAYDMTDAANVDAANAHAFAGDASRIRMEVVPVPLLVVSLRAQGVVLLAPETLVEQRSLPAPAGCDDVVDATLASGIYLATACGSAGMKVYRLTPQYTNPTLLWSTADATTTVDSTNDGVSPLSYIVRSGPSNPATMLSLYRNEPAATVAPTMWDTTFGLEALEVAIRRKFVFILTSETLRVFRRGTTPDVDDTSAPSTPSPPTTAVPASQNTVPCGHWGVKAECTKAWDPPVKGQAPMFHCVWEENLQVCEGPFASVGRRARDVSESSKVRAWVVVVVVAAGVLIVAAAVGITVCLCRRNSRSASMSSPDAGAGKTLPGHPLQYNAPVQGAGATFAHTPQVV